MNENECITSPVTEIWKALQNIENGVVLGGQGLRKVIENNVIR